MSPDRSLSARSTIFQVYDPPGFGSTDAICPSAPTGSETGAVIGMPAGVSTKFTGRFGPLAIGIPARVWARHGGVKTLTSYVPGAMAIEYAPLALLVRRKPSAVRTMAPEIGVPEPARVTVPASVPRGDGTHSSNLKAPMRVWKSKLPVVW
jgi:hypothetical protein